MTHGKKLLRGLAAAPVAFLATMKALYGHFGLYILYIPAWEKVIDLYNAGKAPEWLIRFHNYAANIIINDYMWPNGRWKIAVAAAVAVLGAALFFIVLDMMFPPDPVQKQHVSGVKRLEHKQFARMISKRNARNKRFQPGIKIHPDIVIPRDAETEHIACIGATGAGKTSAVLSPIITQAIKRGDKIVLFDVKGDFTESLANYKWAKLVAPWDERSIRWDIAGEVKDKKDCELLASALVYKKGGNQGGGGKEDFFVNQAKLVFSSMLSCLWNDGALTWENIKKCSTSLQLLCGAKVDGEWRPGLLSRYESAAPALDAIGRGSDQTQATWTTLQDATGKWVYDAALAFGEAPDFTVTDWLHKPGGGVLILRADQTYEALSQALCVSFAALVIKRALQLPEGDARLWLVMDELANFPAIPNLKQGLTLGRDRGLRCVFASQDVTQLYGVYGKEDPHTFINQCANQIWLRANDHKNATMAAEALGTGEVQMLTRGFNASKSGNDPMGHGSTSQGASGNYSLKRETAVHAGEIESLRHSRDIKGGGAEGFLKVSGVPATARLHWPRQALRKQFKSRILAPWTAAKEAPLLPNQAPAAPDQAAPDLPDDLPPLPPLDDFGL